jgi:hypothetical protein
MGVVLDVPLSFVGFNADERTRHMPLRLLLCCNAACSFEVRNHGKGLRRIIRRDPFPPRRGQKVDVPLDEILARCLEFPVA